MNKPGSIERVVMKATDENLTKEDWSKIIAVIDEVNANPTKNASIVIESLRKRLNSPNGNVQLFSLTLLSALAQNCGSDVKKEIASSSMTSCLSNLGTNPNTHRIVLIHLIKILDQLKESFEFDSTLAQISMVYEHILRANPRLAANIALQPESSSQNLPSPTSENHSLPFTDDDEDDEDDEDLRRALELSLKEVRQPQAETEATSHRLAEPKHWVRALYNYTGSEAGELSFQSGDIIEVVDRVYKEWWRGILHDKEGIFPVNYVEQITTSGSEPQKAQTETASALATPLGVSPSQIDEEFIFAQIPVVTKLLGILASASQSGEGGSIIANHDIQQLYHRMASMRPKLIQLIEEYKLEKEELIDLNKKMLQERRGYEALMADAASQTTSSPAQTPQHTATFPMPPKAPPRTPGDQTTTLYSQATTPLTPNPPVPAHPSLKQPPPTQTTPYLQTASAQTACPQTAPAQAPYPEASSAQNPPSQKLQSYSTGSSNLQTLPSQFAGYPPASSSVHAGPIGSQEQHSGTYSAQLEGQLASDLNTQPSHLPYPDSGSPYSNGVASRPY